MIYALATANPGKVKEMKEILTGLGLDVVTRNELGIDMEIEETGTTFLDNAKLKAIAICKASKMPSIADDSGLIVEALDGKPGVYSSSFGGEELSANDRCSYLLRQMEDIKDMEQRRAKFVCTIVCAFPDGKILSASGECNGSIINELKGSSGFGYDPVFMPDGNNKTMAELSTIEKNKISHRGKALVEFSGLLKQHTESTFDSEASKGIKL